MHMNSVRKTNAVKLLRRILKRIILIILGFELSFYFIDHPKTLCLMLLFSVKLFTSLIQVRFLMGWFPNINFEYYPYKIFAIITDPLITWVHHFFGSEVLSLHLSKWLFDLSGMLALIEFGIIRETLEFLLETFFDHSL